MRRLVHQASTIAALALVVACGESSPPDQSAPVGVRDLPLRDLCQQFDLTNHLDLGVPLSLSLATFSAADGLYCGFDGEPDVRRMWIQQIRDDPGEPRVPLSELAAEGETPENVGDVGDNAVLLTDTLGSRTLTTIAFDTGPARWTVNLTNSGGTFLKPEVTSVARNLSSRLTGFTEFNPDTVFGDALCPAEIAPSEAEIAEALGSTATFVKKVTRSRDFVRNFDNQTITWNEASANQSAVAIECSGESQSFEEYVAKADYGYVLNKLDPPTYRPINGLGDGAREAVTPDTKIAYGVTFRATTGWVRVSGQSVYSSSLQEGVYALALAINGR